MKKEKKMEGKVKKRRFKVFTPHCLLASKHHKVAWENSIDIFRYRDLAPHMIKLCAGLNLVTGLITPLPFPLMVPTTTIASSWSGKTCPMKRSAYLIESSKLDVFNKLNEEKS